ncbi:MAG: hypothetical protein EXQ96_01000 [Alphaproteobacteria bacterium]|nr:hypothetical protein [Alphaproteobacteria bacterium]
MSAPRSWNRVACLPAAGAVFAAALLAATPAHAIPKMQLFVEGATYDTDSETWIGSPDETGLLRLWVILAADGDANCDEDTSVCTGSDSTRKFKNVRVAVSFPDPPGGRPVTLVPAFLGGTVANTFGGFTGSGEAPAPSGAQNLNIATKGAPDNGAFVDVDEDGKQDTPLIDDKKSLGPHGEFVVGRTWQEYLLGDFDLGALAPSLSLVLIDDFNGTDPLAPQDGKTGLILAYDIDVSAFVPLTDWHFDAYALLQSKKTETVDTTVFEEICKTTKKWRDHHDLRVQGKEGADRGRG